MKTVPLGLVIPKKKVLHSKIFTPNIYRKKAYLNIIVNSVHDQYFGHQS